jgi:hypothetical protein
MPAVRSLITLLVLSAGLATSACAAAFDDVAAGLARPPESRGLGTRIVGAWLARVTLLDCATRQPLPAPPFRAVVVFHAGGTVSEASGPSVRRTPSFGEWRWVGRSGFFASSVLLTYDANGVFTGEQRIDRAIELSRDGREFVAATETQGWDANGQPQFRGCARGEARRID